MHHHRRLVVVDQRVVVVVLAGTVWIWRRWITPFWWSFGPQLLLLLLLLFFAQTGRWPNSFRFRFRAQIQWRLWSRSIFGAYFFLSPFFFWFLFKKLNLSLLFRPKTNEIKGRLSYLMIAAAGMRQQLAVVVWLLLRQETLVETTLHRVATDCQLQTGTWKAKVGHSVAAVAAVVAMTRRATTSIKDQTNQGKDSLRNWNRRRHLLDLNKKFKLFLSFNLRLNELMTDLWLEVRRNVVAAAVVEERRHWRRCESGPQPLARRGVDGSRLRAVDGPWRVVTNCRRTYRFPPPATTHDTATTINHWHVHSNVMVRGRQNDKTALTWFDQRFGLWGGVRARMQHLNTTAARLELATRRSTDDQDI